MDSLKGSAFVLLISSSFYFIDFYSYNCYFLPLAHAGFSLPSIFWTFKVVDEVIEIFLII